MIPLFAVHMPPREVLMPALERVLYSGYIGQGSQVDGFEKGFGDWVGNSNVLSLNSGTSALHLALRLAGVEGGEVITTPMSCTATNMPILANGAKIVWSDIDPSSGNIDLQDVERKITPNTKAIMVVHWGGIPVDMDGLKYLRNKYDIPIIEDAAHALGATWDGRKIGSHPFDFTCFSLQAIKHITTVDGGLLVARDTDQFKRGKLLRWYGIDREGDRKDFRCEEDIKEYGYKFHMNDVNATIGLAQIKEIDWVVNEHRGNAEYYFSAIQGHDVILPPHAEGASWWLYTLCMKHPGMRNDFMQYMQQEWEVQTSRVHERNDKHTAFREFSKNLPGVDEFTSRMICIPVHSGLSQGQREQVVSAINSYPIRFSMGV